MGTPGKVILTNIATGEQLERWPIDARDLLATGAYVAEGMAPAATEAPLLPGAGVPLAVTRSVDAPKAEPAKIPTGSRKARR
jgi:hypothetical protein